MSIFFRTIRWIIVWALVAFVLASHQVASRPFIDGRSLSWGEAFPIPVLLAFYWGIVSRFVGKVVRLCPVEEKGWLKSIVGHSLLFGLAFALLVSGCATAIFVIYSNPSYASTYGDWKFEAWKVLGAIAAITFHSSLIIYIGIAAIEQTKDFYRKMKSREALAGRLEIDLIKAQLDQLKSQLQPHFLFNTLSAVTTLIDKDPRKAKLTIVKLSELLRVFLERFSENTRKFREELEFIRKYVDIQLVRFGNRLKYHEEIGDDLLDEQIPFLLLQPFVENAVIHGMSNCLTSFTVAIKAQRMGQEIEILISDDGQGQKGATMTEGVGLSNTRKRLSYLYGDQFLLTANNESQGFVIRIVIPSRSRVDP